MNSGTCLTDNQGNPLPQVGGQCNLASMHLDASVIDTPSASEIYGQGMVNNGSLDWEFYNLDPNATAGAPPASQNDFYGNLYSLASFYNADMGASPVNQPMVEQVRVSAPTPCNCPSSDPVKSKGLSDNQVLFLIGLIIAMIYMAKN